ncbi:MAG: hypothetical protein A2V84_07590 [Chloroflexi bacterium RBG_16_70_13]|nr:MAG: hypothetical protein A2V84_07590 [Chloroflexi bacterium RBG_16_70_13]
MRRIRFSDGHRRTVGRARRIRDKHTGANPPTFERGRAAVLIRSARHVARARSNVPLRTV